MTVKAQNKSEPVSPYSHAVPINNKRMLYIPGSPMPIGALFIPEESTLEEFANIVAFDITKMTGFRWRLTKLFRPRKAELMMAQFAALQHDLKKVNDWKKDLRE